MKHIVRKLYWNYEKEEKWLNEMCAKGMALTDYSWCRYVFEDCKSGEYVYRIELLENWANHHESKKYIEFLEESGIEHVASYMRWIYLRRKANEGEFNLFSDAESKIKHYRKVSSFWITIGIFELSIGSANIGIGISQSSNMNLYSGAFLFLIGFALLGLSWRLIKKIRELKKQMQIMQ